MSKKIRTGTFGVTPMDIDDNIENVRPSISSNINTPITTGRKLRRTTRTDGLLNNPTTLKGTHIFYYDDLLIGKGATGAVYEGFHISPDRPAAIKRVRLEDAKVFENELSIWQRLCPNVTRDNAYIVQLFAWTKWLDGGRWNACYFAMELATTDLNKIVAMLKSSPLDQDKIRTKLFGYLRDAARGLRWLHDKRVIHRDIKPENILIFEDEGGKEIAKLGDFGISRKIENSSTGTNSRGIGTSDWMSPEGIRALFRNQEFRSSIRIDIFSFGLTAHFTMSLGIHPFLYSKEHGYCPTQNISNPEVRPTSLKVEEHSANHLFQWMMLRNEYQRPKILQVLNHPFFWSTKYSLEFLVDVARAFDNKRDYNANELRTNLNDMFHYLYAVYVSDAEGRPPPPPGESCVNWKMDMGYELMNLLTRRHGKKYNGKNVMSLLELIRDKWAHAVEVDEKLLQDQYFGEEGIYSTEKFGTFFLNKFPYLVIFLYTVFSKPMKDYGFIKCLKLEYKLMGQADIPSLPPLKPFFEDKMVK